MATTQIPVLPIRGLSDEEIAFKKTAISNSDAQYLWDHGLHGFLDWKEEETRHVDMFDVALWTEPLNAAMFMDKFSPRVTLHPSDRYVIPFNERFISYPDGSCSDGTTFQAKHVGERFSTEDIIKRYYGACQWQIMVTQTKGCWLSIIFGNGIDYDKRLILQDVGAIAMLAGIASQALMLIDAGGPTEKLPFIGDLTIDWNFVVDGAIDMSDDQEWVAAARTMIDTADAAFQYEEARKKLKQLIPVGAGKARGAGVLLSRTKAGIRITRELS